MFLQSSLPCLQNVVVCLSGLSCQIWKKCDYVTGVELRTSGSHWLSADAVFAYFDLIGQTALQTTAGGITFAWITRKCANDLLSGGF